MWTVLIAGCDKIGRFASEEVILELIFKTLFTNSYLRIEDVCIA